MECVPSIVSSVKASYSTHSTLTKPNTEEVQEHNYIVMVLNLVVFCFLGCCDYDVHRRPSFSEICELLSSSEVSKWLPFLACISVDETHACHLFL